jgi:hypothetical protein
MKQPEEAHLSQEKIQLLSGEIIKLVEKGAVSPVGSPQRGSFMSRMFLVPKKGEHGGQ